MNRNVVVAIGLAVVLARSGRASDLPAAKDLLVATVSTAGGGSMLFQGKVNDGALTGHLFQGEARAVVEGTVAADGTVSGVVKTTEGVAIGTFSGAVGEDAVLTGIYTANAGVIGFQAPAENLPVPE